MLVSFDLETTEDVKQITWTTCIGCFAAWGIESAWTERVRVAV